MAITSEEIVSVLQIQNTASLITGAATITDVSNYGSIGVATPDVVKILLWITDPTGDTFYKNTGYDAADFTSPDLVPLTSPVSYSFTLPTDSTGAYLQGQYNVNMKVQVNQSSVYTEASSRLYLNACSCCNGIVPVVNGIVSYNTANVSIVDNTNYGSWMALTNTLKIYPPTNTGSAQQGIFHGAPATLYYEPPTDTFPYTGEWQWTLTSDISFVDPTTGTTTTCRITGQGHFSVVQSQLCKIRCLLDKYRTEFYAMLKLGSLNAGQIEQQTRNWNLASDDYLMAFASERCGLPQTTIDKYIANIYLITGIDPNCECGCGDGTSQPLVPTSIINGTDGTDGTIIYSGSGAPSGGLGVVGDYYVDTATQDFYKKTGASTWSVLFNMKGATGAPGADGADGASSLVSLMVVSTTAQNVGGAGFEALANKIVVAGQVASQQDELKIHAEFNCTATDPSDATRQASIFVGATNLFTGFYIPLFAAKNIKKIVLDITITRTNATLGTYEASAKFYNSVGGYLNQYVQPVTSASITWASNNTFSAEVLSPNADMSVNAWEIIYYKHKA